MAVGRTPLRGSAHQPLQGAVAIAPVGAAERFRTNIYLRRRPDGPPFPDPDEIGAQPPLERQYLTREEFEARYGAAQADADAVANFAAQHGLMVVATSLARRTVTVEGTAASFSAAFATTLTHFSHPAGDYRAHQSPIHVPADLRDAIVGVVGLDERIAARPMVAVHPGIWNPVALALAPFAAAAAAQHHVGPHLAQLHKRILSTVQTKGHVAADANDWAAELAKILEQANRAAAMATLDALDIKTPPGVAQIYNFPPGTDGSGQAIGIIELGGGYVRSDLEAYFAFLDLPMPNIRDVSVLGGTNSPGKNAAYDIEVAIDLDVAGGMAPGADLVCYFSNVTAMGFIDAVHTAIHDRENHPSVISISWAISEGVWLATPGFMDIFDDVLSEAPLLGVTVCCASGDYGAFSELHDGRVWVDYPGSNPHVLACGGTALYSRGDITIAEVAWNTLLLLQQATGGGVSQRFPLPPWQEKAGVPLSANPGQGSGRGVPDVAAVGDPLTGYLVSVNGKLMPMAGTSSVAPLYAALLTRINQSLGVNVGYIHPLIYGRASDAFRDIVFGNNPIYWAVPGWDACTGWGSPDGVRLLERLRTAGD